MPSRPTIAARDVVVAAAFTRFFDALPAAAQRRWQVTYDGAVERTGSDVEAAITAWADLGITMLPHPTGVVAIAELRHAGRMDEWSEADHPRAPDGKFGEGSGGKAKPAKAKPAKGAKPKGHKPRAFKAVKPAPAPPPPPATPPRIPTRVTFERAEADAPGTVAKGTVNLPVSVPPRAPGMIVAPYIGGSSGPSQPTAPEGYVFVGIEGRPTFYGEQASDDDKASNEGDLYGFARRDALPYGKTRSEILNGGNKGDGERYQLRYAEADEWDAAAAEAVALGVLDPATANAAGWTREQMPAWRVKPLPSTLYHVTTAGDSIRRGGGELLTREELGQHQGAGLGGGSPYTISFTDDAGRAEQIADSMREYRAVLSGGITVQQMVADPTYGAQAKAVLPLIHNVEAMLEGKWRSRRLADDPGDVPPKYDGFGSTSFEEGIDPELWTATADGKFWERPLSESEDREFRDTFYKRFAPARESAGGPMYALFEDNDSDALEVGGPIEVLTYKAEPGAAGYYRPEEREWRTWSGKAAKLVENDP